METMEFNLLQERWVRVRTKYDGLGYIPLDELEAKEKA